MNEIKIQARSAHIGNYEMRILLFFLTGRYKSSLFGKSPVFFQWFISFDTLAKIRHHVHVPSLFITFLHCLEFLMKPLTFFITIITKIIRKLFKVTK